MLWYRYGHLTGLLRFTTFSAHFLASVQSTLLHCICYSWPIIKFLPVPPVILDIVQVGNSILIYDTAVFTAFVQLHQHRHIIMNPGRGCRTAAKTYKQNSLVEKRNELFTIIML